MPGRTSPLRGPASERLHIERVHSTVVYAVFVMLLMWLLALGGVGVGLTLGSKRRKWETGFATFLGALLFALPAIRNALPGAPPIGARFDFISFFWAEA